jgi:hypothetical protein
MNAHGRHARQGGRITAVTKITCRRLIALAAAYAVALQAVLAGFAVLATSAPAEICAPAGSSPPPGSIPMGPDCAACPVLCGSAGPHGMAPDTVALAAPPLPSFGIERRVAPAVPPPGQRRLPPSRGPPAA